MRRAYQKGFWVFLFCSIFIHFFLMAVLPDFLGNDSGVIPIQLLTSKDLQLEVFPENKRNAYPEPDQDKEEPGSQKTALDPMLLRRKVAELSLGESLKKPSPNIPTPSKLAGVSREERIKKIAKSPFYQKLAQAFAKNRERRRYGYRSMESSIDASPETLKDETFEADPGTERIFSRLRPTGQGSSPDLAEWKRLGIKGPAAQRKLAFVPSTPDLKTGEETELEMKFWVRPNGTVGRVVPVKPSGNAEFEKIVATYVGRWRFEALPESEPQADVWGTVTIRFESE